MPVVTVLRFTDPVSGQTLEATNEAWRLQPRPEDMPVGWYQINGEVLAGSSRVIMANRVLADPTISGEALLAPATPEELASVGLG